MRIAPDTLEAGLGRDAHYFSEHLSAS